MIVRVPRFHPSGEDQIERRVGDRGPTISGSADWRVGYPEYSGHLSAALAFVNGETQKSMLNNTRGKV